MDKEKLKLKRFLRIYFIDSELIIDVNSDIWEKILNQRERYVIDYLSGELTMRSAMKKVCGLDCKKVFILLKPLKEVKP